MAFNYRTKSGQIDWEAVHERMAEVARAIESADELSPEQARTLLDERAHRLAETPVDAPSAGEIIEVLTFRLNDAPLAIEARLVLEVLRSVQLTPLPYRSDFVAGVTNLRGDILTVFDIRKFFDAASHSDTQTSQVIVLGQENADFGLLVDGVEDVDTLRLNSLLPAPASLGEQAREYTRGVTTDGMLVLDGVGLLEDERLYVDDSDW